MKKISIILGFCVIALIAGCGNKKKEEVVVADPTPAVTIAPEATVTPTAIPPEGVVVNKQTIKGVPVTETPTPEPTLTPTPTAKPTPTPEPTAKPTTAPEPTEAPQEVSSEYVPVSGYYTNGSSGDFRYINISSIDDGSFRFSIHDGESGETVFKSHVASFEQPNGTTAVYHGQSYTLYFDCSSYGIVTVSGFSGGPSGNTYWNTDIHQAG